MIKKKVLVCGATGFIGRNIAEAYAALDEYEVFGSFLTRPPLENTRIKPIRLDLRNREQATEAIRGMDIVIQCAAVTSGSKDIVSQPYIHTTDNAVMNSILFRAAHENSVKNLVFFSCAIMYQPSERPVRESDLNLNQEIHNNYFGAGWTKVYLEKMCEFYSRLGRTKYTVIRHSNIYGPHDKYDLDRSHVFGATITKVLATENDSVVVWGSGNERRDLLYIDDLVAFVKAVLNKQESPFELINVGSGHSISINELVKKIIFHSGKNVALVHDESKPHIDMSLCLDITRAKTNYGWIPAVPLDEGIEKTISWYKKNYMGGKHNKQDRNQK